MGQENNTQYELNSVGLEGSKITEVQLCDSSKISTIDPQVKVGGSPKRKFSSHYKQQIILGMQLTNLPTTCSVWYYEYLPCKFGRIDGSFSN